MRRLLLLPILAALLSACGPLPAGLPRLHGPPAEAQLIQSEYDILLQDYVLPLDPATLGLAASTGMHDAVAQQLGDSAARGFPYATFRGDAAAVRDEIAQQYAAAERSYPQVDSTALAHDAMRAVAQSVDDCHTNFLTRAEYQQQQAEIQGTVQFGGIGASLKERPGSTPLIGEVFPGLPAATQGLHRGDAIVRVNGKDVSGLSAADVVALIRGPVGTVVQLDISRVGNSGTLHFAITRQDVAPPPLSAGLLGGAGAPIGYVHLYDFTPEMPPALQSVLQQFADHQANLWIVDLRDNSGGTVQALEDAASFLLPAGPIARLQSRDGQSQTLDASGQRLPAPRKLVLLTNSGSASASEIFAAALQERGAATVVGTPTAGCVAVGELHALADGSAIEYAADRVYTPVRDRVLNGSGVTPDLSVPMSLDDLAAGRDPQLAAAEAVVTGQLAPQPGAAPPSSGSGTPPKLLPGIPPAAGG